MKKIYSHSLSTLFSLYEKMLKIRLTEEAIAQNYSQQEMKCPVHLAVGQEAIAAGISQHLLDNDAVMSTHRCHGHYLAKGGNLEALIAELYGKVEGCAQGKGGSMHLLDLSAGFWGSSAIVGGNIPLAAGLAFSFQLKKSNQISVAYFGDGAVEEGVLFETINFSALKKLPVLFVCENNLFSVLTRIEERQANTKIADKIRGFGIESHSLDGNNVLEISDFCATIIPKIRDGHGPVFMEAKTYRMRTHCGPQFDGYQENRTEKEFIEWQKKCPIQNLKQEILFRSPEASLNLEAIEKKICEQIQSAFTKAKEGAFPSVSSMKDHIYA